MIDPDQREQMARDAEQRAQRCRTTTAGHHRFLLGHHECTVCGAPNPEAQKPRITLVVDDLRAVYNPRTETLYIEKRANDSLGAERWDVVQTMTAMQARELVANGGADARPSFYVFQLLTKGRNPNA